MTERNRVNVNKLGPPNVKQKMFDNLRFGPQNGHPQGKLYCLALMKRNKVYFNILL